MRAYGSRFGALLAPGGLCVAEYRVTRRGVELSRYARDAGPVHGAADAVARLGELLSAEGAAPCRLALTVSGFGSCHHQLSLPPAAPEVIRPVVARELVRIYPEAHDAHLDHVTISVHDDPKRPRHDLLAAAAPRELVQRLIDVLGPHRIEVEHLTVPPRALQRLFEAFAGTSAPTAVLLLVADGPVLGFFHERELRLVQEPPPVGAVETSAELRLIAEQVERGSLFLRQQFRGARVERLLVAAEPGRQELVEAALREELMMDIGRFGPADAPPEALLALGAALDAADGAGLNLLPPALRPARGEDRLARALGVASACLLVLVALWWSWSAVDAAGLARDRAAALESALEEQILPYGGIRGVVDERRDHAERVVLLAQISAERRGVQDALRAVALAAPAAVQLDTLRIAREGSAWRIAVAGRAVGDGSAATALAVNRLYTDLPRRLRLEEEPTLLRLEHVVPGEADGRSATAVAMTFAMDFIVRFPEEVPR